MKEKIVFVKDFHDEVVTNWNDNDSHQQLLQQFACYWRLMIQIFFFQFGGQWKLFMWKETNFSCLEEIIVLSSLDNYEKIDWVLFCVLHFFQIKG